MNDGSYATPTAWSSSPKDKHVWGVIPWLLHVNISMEPKFTDNENAGEKELVVWNVDWK